MTLYLKGHWNYERSKLELLNLLNKNALFWNFQVLSLVFPMPLEIQSHTVPHLKALISGNLEPRGLRWGSTFRVCQALFKSAVLLHKEAYRADLFSSECMLSFSNKFLRYIAMLKKRAFSLYCNF